MLRRLGIRGKVFAALAMPVLVLFAAATFISWQSIESAQVARATSAMVGTGGDFAPLVQAIQNERQLSVAVAAAPGSMTAELAAARAATDAASVRFSAAVAAIDIVPLGLTFGEALERTSTGRAGLAGVRENLDGARVPGQIIDTQYTSVIALHVDLAFVMSSELADRSQGRILNAYGLVGATGEKLIHELPSAMQVISAGGADAAAALALATDVTLDTAAYSDARTAVNQLRLQGLQLPSLDAAYQSQRLLLTSGDPGAIATIDPVSYQEHSMAVLQSIGVVNDEIQARTSALAEQHASAAVRQAAITIAATALTALLSIVIALLVARQIVVPLRRLTKAAGDVRAQLPRLVEQVATPGEAPELSLIEIPVTSRDEVGRLAAAFNDVNTTTIQVAQEQAALRGSIAEMFVNVARRDQVLLNRQISFIDSLERSEEDPGVLANLFRLDHLATRMRRNAESLLVLAGIDSGRRIRDAMALSDVIRTASSEIEQYHRIQLELRADPSMRGFNALAAAHLLAELLENATMFSEPETPVDVETSTDGEFMRVVVRDRGLGMSEGELEAANEKIRSTSAGDVLGAQRLGFYVVGRLAARLGAEVTLVTGVGGSGVDAVVRFPVSMFEDLGAPSAGEGPRDMSQGAARYDGVEPESVGVPVDLDALTDGATLLGLPRRRASGDAAEQPVRVPAVEDDDRTIVLPLRADAILSPEILAAGGDWAPAVPAAGSIAGLPSRARAASDRWREPAAEHPAPQPPAAPSSPAGRGGLFAGFRGRVVDAPAPEAATPPKVVIPELVIPLLVLDDEAWAPEVGFEALNGTVRISEPVAVVEELVVTAAPEPATVVAPDVAPDPEPQRTPREAKGADFTAFSGFYGQHVPVSGDEPAGFVSTLNEARAWGADVPAMSSAASWLPASATSDAGSAAQPDAAQPDAAQLEVAQPATPEPVPSRNTPEDDPTSASTVPHVVLAAASTLEPVAVAGATTSDAEIGQPAAAAGFAPVPTEGEPARPARRGHFGWLRRKPATTSSAPVAVLVADPVEVASVADALVPPAVTAAVQSLRPSAWEAPSGGRPEVDVPVVDGRGSAAQATAHRWNPQREVIDQAFTPATFTPSAPPKAWSAQAWSAEHAGASAPADAGDRTQIPQPALPLARRAPAPGALDDDVAAMLTLRSDIQEQALAELSQLSAYRPSTVGASGSGGGSLQRRVPSAVPAAPEIVLPDDARPVVRDPERLRSRLSSFQSGTDRGRREASPDADDAANGDDHPVDRETPERTSAPTC